MIFFFACSHRYRFPFAYHCALENAFATCSPREDPPTDFGANNYAILAKVSILHCDV